MKLPVRIFFFVQACCFYAAAGDHPLIYSTLLGGGTNLSAFVTVDGAGNCYVTGRTRSLDFPVTNAWQPEIAGGDDVFLVKLDAAGKPLFATYFGGSGNDYPEEIILDRDGNVTIVGGSSSTDLPVTPGAFAEDYLGGSAFGSGDGFIAKFSPDGSELFYCSYLGGSGDDFITGIAVDPDGNLVLCGTTDSPDFPQATVIGTRGVQDVFICKLNAGGERLLWCKMIAGNRTELANVALGSANEVYFSGFTLSTNLPVTPNARQAAHGFSLVEFVQEWNGYIGALAPDGSTLQYLSYFGEAEFSRVRNLAVAQDGSVVITGDISETVLASTNLQSRFGGGFSDAFVARLRPGDWNIEWLSYLGGSDTEFGGAVKLGKQGEIYVAGATSSHDFPLRDSLHRRADGSTDAFLVKCGADGRSLIYSTHFGGQSEDFADGLALGPDDSPVIAGTTESADFPVRNAFQPEFSGLREAFVLKIKPGPIPPLLEMTRSGSSIIVSWLAEAEGFVFETSSALSADWKEVEVAPLLLGEKKAAVLRMTNEPQFFRLKRP